MMKVKDLVEKLLKLDQEKEICILEQNGNVESIEQINYGDGPINRQYSFEKTSHYLLYNYLNLSKR